MINLHMTNPIFDFVFVFLAFVIYLSDSILKLDYSILPLRRKPINEKAIFSADRYDTKASST